MNSDLPATESISSIFQESVCIRGDLELSQPLLLDGRLYGNIDSKSHVIIGEKGYVEGKITADKITMWGSIKGDMLTETLCVLEDTARVEGDITSGRLSMKEGASFVGSAKIQTKAKANVESPSDGKVVNRLKESQSGKDASNATNSSENGVNVNADL